MLTVGESAEEATTRFVAIRKIGRLSGAVLNPSHILVRLQAINAS